MKTFLLYGIASYKVQLERGSKNGQINRMRLRALVHNQQREVMVFRKRSTNATDLTESLAMVTPTWHTE